MSISERNDKSNAAAPAQRLEIFTGAGRRRAWTAEEKAAIVAESVEDGAVVSHVARRHGLTPQQLFAWRRQARRGTEVDVATPAFTPIVVAAPSAGAVARCRRREQNGRRAAAFDRIGHRRIERLGVARRRGRDGEGDHRRAEGCKVIGPSGAVRVLVATRPVDFRKGAEGLAALVRDVMGADPFDGAVYVFRAKRADRVKLFVLGRHGRVPVREASWRTAGSNGRRSRTA